MSNIITFPRRNIGSTISIPSENSGISAADYNELASHLAYVREQLIALQAALLQSAKAAALS